MFLLSLTESRVCKGAYIVIRIICYTAQGKSKRSTGKPLYVYIVLLVIII